MSELEKLRAEVKILRVEKERGWAWFGIIIYGVEALIDNRSKWKSPDEMSELEKLRAEVKILRVEKERGWAWFGIIIYSNFAHKF